MKKKVVIITATLAVFFNIVPTDVWARSPGITKKEVFRSYSPDEAYPFAEIIEEDNTQYKLVNVDYEILEKDKITVTEDVAVDIKSDPIPEDQDYKPKEVLKQGDLELKLTASAPEEFIVKNKYTIPYTSTVTYDYTVSDEEIPKEREIEVQEGKQKKKLSLALSSVTEGESHWVDATLNITFNGYNSEFYMLGDVQVPHQNDKPALKGYEETILQMMGLSTAEYQIQDIVWNGDAYEKDGILCRDAVAIGKKAVRGKVAVYESSVNKKKNQKYVIYTDRYEGKKTIDTNKAEYTIEAVASYEFYSSTKGLKTSLQVVTALFIISVLISISLVVLGRKQKQDLKKQIQQKNKIRQKR